MIKGSNGKFDLEERTSRFAEDMIRLIKGVRITPVNENIVKQLLRCVTSMGANYMEANGAESRKDFLHKTSICKKEAKETLYWLRMLALVEEGRKAECRKLYKEGHELTLIFSKIVYTTRSKEKER